MKKLKDRIRRKIKYYRVGFHQASKEDRVGLGMSALGVLVYVWWVLEVLAI